jgi:hypothetical protein
MLHQLQHVMQLRRLLQSMAQPRADSQQQQQQQLLLARFKEPVCTFPAI